MRVLAAAESVLYKVNKQEREIKRIKIENKMKAVNLRGNDKKEKQNEMSNV